MAQRYKIYTKQGDLGETSLLGQNQVPKQDPRIEAYGTVDELNSCLGICRNYAEEIKYSKLTSQIEIIQNQLFNLGSILACASKEHLKKLKQISEDDIKNFEIWIDQYEEQLPELNNFILPGGSKLASFLHLARTICRRAERSFFALTNNAEYQNIGSYLNRLSDLLFIMARITNFKSNTSEVLWK